MTPQNNRQSAFSRPGIEPRWTGSAKEAVGTAYSASSRVMSLRSQGKGFWSRTRKGRGWPLLTGERGHYEFAAGRDVRRCSSLSTGSPPTGGKVEISRSVCSDSASKQRT